MKGCKRKAVRINDEHREGKCNFYSEKKKRFCRQTISKRVPEPFSSEAGFKPMYCGNHQNIYSTLFKERKKTNVIHRDSKRGRRIPCPIDPSHMIYESKLKSHIVKCPKARIANEERQRKYYRQDINTGGYGDLDVDDSSKDVLQIDPKAFAIRILTAYKSTFLQSSNINDIDVTSLTKEQIYEAIPTKNHFLTEKELGLESMITKHRVKIGGSKHLEQIGSLVGHARANNLLEGSDTVLEMGAGRATTGFVVSGICAANGGKKVKLALVEKCGSRSKADAAFRRDKEDQKESDDNSNGDQAYFSIEDVDIHRIKCDLAHVHIPEALSEAKAAEANGTPFICQEVTDEKRDILVIAKHLCGAGTDLALKSMVPIKHRVSGYLLATCCHGLCSWNLYVGRDFLRKAMLLGQATESCFGEKEFNLMKRWACGTVIPEFEEESNDEITKKQTETDEHKSCEDDLIGDMSVTKVSNSIKLKCGPQGLGRACQRLIDYGRCEFLKNRLLGDTPGEVKMCHYVKSDVTPQNALLYCKIMN